MSRNHPFETTRDREDDSSNGDSQEEGDTRPGTSIARMTASRSLSPTVLDENHIIHLDMPNRRDSDRFRELRTNLLLRRNTRNPVIVVTGVSVGCGATFLAKNLAVSIAMEEERTALLMDCNLRDPSLESTFSFKNPSPGLLDYLNMPAMGLAKIIHETGIPRLRFIPAGRSRKVSAEHFASLRMRGMIQELRDRYPDRCLILDTPPANGSPDARILAELADLVVLVAGEGMHLPEAVAEAASVFPAASFAGIVYNQVP